jgi:ribonuclease HI
MPASQPHILLFSEADSSPQRSTGRWHFLLESIQGETLVEASDEEPGTHGERLELLAVVRGLEALDQPSRVTLVTPSRQVSRGLRAGLDEWRRNGWRWERDGRMVPVKNRDLWQRIDWAMRFHEVQCRSWRIDLAHQAPQPAPRPERASSGSRRWAHWGERAAEVVRRWWRAPTPWQTLGAAGPSAP